MNNTLPAGVVGTARLTEIGFREALSGKGRIFVAVANVVEPNEYTTFQTVISIPLWRIGRYTEVEQWQRILNELAKLGVDIQNLNLDKELYTLFDVIKQKRLLIRFRTWESKGFICHSWLGVREDRGISVGV